MSVIKVIPRANSVLFIYPDGVSKTFLLSSYLTASNLSNNITVQSSTGEYAIYKFPYTGIRDNTNTVFGGSAAATVTALNGIFSDLEVDVATLETNFGILDSEALRNTSLITDLANVEKFVASTKGDYLLAVDAANPGGVKTVAPATFISNNSIVTSNSSPTFVTPTITSSLYLDSSSTGIVFEGGTADANETTLQAINPTADRTIYLPNASGTVALVGTNGEASFDAITFDLTPTTADGDGVMRYDPDVESLVFTTANGNKLVLGNTYLPAINKTASTIALGTAVKAVGVEGQRFKIEPFDADVDDPLYFIGLTEKSMAAEAEGVVVSVGYVKGINTSTYTVGTILYASGTAGQLTSTQPAKPAADIVVAMVTVSSANGSVFVRPTVHHQLGDLQDVSVASPTAGVLVQRNSGNTLWTKTPYAFPTSDGTNGQVLATNGTGTISWSTVSGGGTPAGNTGEIQFNNAGAFGATSGLFWDNTNGRLGIGLNTGLTYEITASSADTNGILVQNTAASSGTAGSNVVVMSNDNAALTTSDRLGSIAFGGSTGVGTVGIGASIQAFTAGTYAPASLPSLMTFSTVAPGTSTLAERFRIAHDGTATYGSNSTGTYRFLVHGGGSTSSTQNFTVRNSGGSILFQTRDDGAVAVGAGGPEGNIRLSIRGAGSTSTTSSLRLYNSTPATTFQIRDDGAYTFFGGSLGLAQTGYTTFTNLNTLRTGDADTLTLGQLSDIVGTLILDLKTKGIIAS